MHRSGPRREGFLAALALLLAASCPGAYGQTGSPHASSTKHRHARAPPASATCSAEPAATRIAHRCTPLNPPHPPPLRSPLLQHILPL
jgi:hypothetical protein